MSVITYTKDGITDIPSLICSMVIDLTGGGTPAVGSAAEHMKVIYPEGFDPSDPTTLSPNGLVVLEATPNIDPFARTDPTVEDVTKDPWRIAFHTSCWYDRPSIEKNTSGNWVTKTEDSLTAINSLAVYIGTPSTLNFDPNTGDVNLGWVTTNQQKLPYFKGFPDLAFNGYVTTMTSTGSSLSGGLFPPAEWRYKETYSGKDLVEPVGNTGARWTNSFDPTEGTKKFQPKVNWNAGISPDPATYSDSPNPWDGPDVKDPDQLFINRYVSAGVKAVTFGGFSASATYAQPISYRLVLSDHGLFLGCWGPDPEENGKGFSWLLVQRPVDKKTGIVRGLPEDPVNPGNRPLFCVNSVNGKFWKFVVREHDSAVPSARKDAAKSTPDSGAVINPYQQQSLTENGEYVITFLNNLNSSRFKYSDELDMLGTVSSDVVGGGSEIDVSVYNESDKRTYHALWSSGSYGTKMRIMVVKDIPSPNTPE